MCFFFCEKNINDVFFNKLTKKPANKRCKVYNARSLSLRENIIEKASERDDALGKYLPVNLF